MSKKIEEAQREFNAILEYVWQRAMDPEIHDVEDSIYRILLRLGRMPLEIFVLRVGADSTPRLLRVGTILKPMQQ